MSRGFTYVVWLDHLPNRAAVCRRAERELRMQTRRARSHIVVTAAVCLRE